MRHLKFRPLREVFNDPNSLQTIALSLIAIAMVFLFLDGGTGPRPGDPNPDAPQPDGLRVPTFDTVNA